MNSLIEPNDIFSWAATQRHEARRRDLAAPQPLPVPNRLLPMDKRPGDSAFKPVKKLNTADDIRRELAKLRRRMSKFLVNLAPSIRTSRISIPLESFDWRQETEDDRRNFLSTLSGAGRWDRVSIPHYGPPLGRAVTYYRTDFEITADMLATGALFAVFDGVDYKAHVFINDAFLGSHEGFFAGFEFDFTNHARLGVNSLVVKVENDHICMGSISDVNGQTLDGNKIYAATGLGYNDPKLGWHHCPPGMGIYQGVRIEARPKLFIHDIFVRPLPDERCAEAWIEVCNCDLSNAPVVFELSLFGQNFKATVFRNRRIQPTTAGVRGHGDLDKEMMPVIRKPAGPGVSQFRIVFELPRARHWNPATPWLYQLQVKLLDEHDKVSDARHQQFGMRTFRQDENSTPKGKFYLNDREIRLRGANTMGHEQMCVFHKDWSQLIDDILLAKLCNMNFLRLTQRPVQREVYEYCDRLGLMTQTDLPLFGCLRRNQLCEAIRQAEEMERLIRSHPCNILVSYINEPFPNGQGRPHRNLTRDELEQFFDMASRVVRMSNPERVIKNVEGDYDPPTSAGMPDNHCYCGWYVGHAVDLGRLNRGYWMPIKAGWHYGCGEFGAEGLDSLEVMRKHYPKGWLPLADQKSTAPWRPDKLSSSQTNKFQYLWFPSQTTPETWIKASQQHQAWVVRTMTEAFRRDWRMNSFAVHLFIDAWPCGWMKAIMDVHRIPKRAFFAYREALTPLTVSLRTDRHTFFAGETIEMEAWVCNDNHDVPYDARLHYQFEVNGRILQSGRAAARIPQCSSRPQGLVRFAIPQLNQRNAATIRLALANQSGKILVDTAQEVEVFPMLPKLDARRLFIIGHRTGLATILAKELGLDYVRHGTPLTTDIIVVDNLTDFGRQQSAVDAAVKAGATAVFLELPIGKHNISGGEINIVPCGMGQRHFVDCNTGHASVADFQPYDFWFWHDGMVGYPTPLLATVLDPPPVGWTTILESGNGSWTTDWKPVPAAVERRFGQGIVRVCQVKLAHRTMTNPSAAIFARRLLDICALKKRK
ncbi:MAG TPA: glycoside hydrolase family 2 TIM barrel-domain containing protein [Verrucomicrobiae bacterium]|nr:glycoside hydrolase family 2 TIM barrel-domain containing protein [Verrucomicrobiae bacterium]